MAVGFDGVNDAVSIPDTNPLRLNGSFTIEFWAKLRSFANSYPGILGKGHRQRPGRATASGTGPTFVRPSSAPESTERAAGAAGALTSTTWKHYAASYDTATTTLRWYVNGALDTTYTGISYPTNTATSALQLGKGDQYGAEVLDEVALYTSGLSGQQVAAHYAAASTSNCTDIGGATGQTYIPTAADVGSRIQLAVTAKNAADRRRRPPRPRPPSGSGRLRRLGADPHHVSEPIDRASLGTRTGQIACRPAELIFVC